MAKSLSAYLKEGHHLPSALKDFHDQKEVFKAIDDAWMSKKRAEGDKLWGEFYDVNWTAAHVYTIDYFLRFMALHGYTLQRTRMRFAEGELANLRATLTEARERRLQAIRADAT